MISKRRRQLVGSALRSHPSTEPIQFLSRVLNGEIQPAAVPDSNADVTSEETPTRIPVWFRIVAVIALLWNLMGCAAFAAEMLIQEEMMKTMTPEAQEWAKGIPGWIYVVYFLAVSSGTLACIGLLVRKSWATPLFAVSLVSVVIQMGYTMFIAKGSDVLGTADKIMSLVVIVLAAVLLWFSMYVRKRSWMSS